MALVREPDFVPTHKALLHQDRALCSGNKLRSGGSRALQKKLGHKLAQQIGMQRSVDLIQDVHMAPAAVQPGLNKNLQHVEQTLRATGLPCQIKEHLVAQGVPVPCAEFPSPGLPAVPAGLCQARPVLSRLSGNKFPYPGIKEGKIPGKLLPAAHSVRPGYAFA